MIQARLAAETLARRFPDHEFVLAPMSTHADRDQSMRLTEASREGVFVKELEQALREGRAELAVHSAKDLPTLATPGLTIAAFLARADARDALIARQPATLSSLPAGARIGTGSPRRVAQIAAARPDLQVVGIRGNVDTRLGRLREGQVDALILAVAGLQRLGRLDEAHQLLPFDVMLPAPGQGALALQALEGSEAARLAAQVDDRDTSRAVNAERALLRRLGGGCLSAIGAYARVDGDALVLDAVVLAEDGKRVLRARAGPADDGQVVDEVAGRLEAAGAGALLRPSAVPGPLAGLRVMVTRADAQSASLAQALEEQGARVVVCPVIVIEPIDVDPERVRLEPYEWLVLTSANGVDRLFQLASLAQRGLPPHLRGLPAHIKVAAIGPQTAARLAEHGVHAALVPDRYIAEELGDELTRVIPPGSRVLLARAEGARDILPRRLRDHGLEVDVVDTYRTRPPAGLRERLAERLKGIDMVTFTSSSTVRHFVEALSGPLDSSVLVACIGPITAQTAHDLGLRVAIIAQEYTTRGLVDAIVRSRTSVSA
jgi:hydroxymethylbilane synthase